MVEADKAQKENRLFKRFDTLKGWHFELSDDLDFILKNVSLGGISFDLDEKIPMGKTISVGSKMDGEPGVSILEGKILRCSEAQGWFNYGIKFNSPLLTEALS